MQLIAISFASQLFRRIPFLVSRQVSRATLPLPQVLYEPQYPRYTCDHHYKPIHECEMAVNYSTQTYTSPNNQLPLFGAQQISPADSATNSPNNVSPTSPRAHNYVQYHIPGQVRQLRPMKSPLYVPAALRPTERPERTNPMTPPKSLHASLESLENRKTDGHVNNDSRTAPLDLVVENRWIGNEHLGEVTGEPTREHWKVSTIPYLLTIALHNPARLHYASLLGHLYVYLCNNKSDRMTCDCHPHLKFVTNVLQQADEQSPNCDSPTCRSSFNLFKRRHHCRHCGHIFCSDHSGYTIPLNQEARFHPDGIPSRACDMCHRHYQKWDTARSIRRTNSDNSQDDGSNNDLAVKRAGLDGKSGLISQGLGSGNSEQTVGSVPKDWAWSTF